MELADDGIEVQSEVTPREAAYGALWLFFRNPLIRVIYVVPVLAALAAVVLAFNGRALGMKPLVPALAFYLVMPSIVVVSAFLTQSKRPLKRRTAKYRLSVEGVHIESTVGTASLTWQAFSRAVETKRAFYLGLASGVWHFIPKRCFSSASDCDQTRELLSNALGKQAHVSGASRAN